MCVFFFFPVQVCWSLGLSSFLVCCSVVVFISMAYFCFSIFLRQLPCSVPPFLLLNFLFFTNHGLTLTTKHVAPDHEPSVGCCWKPGWSGGLACGRLLFLPHFWEKRLHIRRLKIWWFHYSYADLTIAMLSSESTSFWHAHHHALPANQHWFRIKIISVFFRKNTCENVLH